MSSTSHNRRAEELVKRITLPESYHRVVDNDFKALDHEPDMYSIYRRRIHLSSSSKIPLTSAKRK